MNYFTKCLCNKAAKLHFINLDYIDKYLAVLRNVKYSKEESTLNKVIYLNLKVSEIIILLILVWETDNYNINKRNPVFQTQTINFLNCNLFSL